MADREKLKLTKEEAQNLFEPGTPKLLNIEEVATLLRISKSTLYSWRSQGRLRGCSQKLGKRVLYLRDRLITKLINEGV